MKPAISPMHTGDGFGAVVIQLGARMRYAVPRILHSRGHLVRFHTDIVGDRGWPLLLRAIPPRARPQALRRLLQRRIEGIPRCRVSAHSVLGLKIAFRERNARGPGEMAEAHIRSGHELCRLVIRRGFDGVTMVGAIGTSSQPFLEAGRRAGLATFKEQIIAPVSRARNPGPGTGRFPGVGDEPRNRGLVSAIRTLPAGVEIGRFDHLRIRICPPRRRACGRAGQHCVVVPYGVSLPAGAGRTETPVSGRPLRVITLGAVSLRKGAPYVREAAEAMRGRAEFHWLGRLDLNEFGRAQMASAVALAGHVPRDEAMRRLAEALQLPCRVFVR